MFVFPNRWSVSRFTEWCFTGHCIMGGSGKYTTLEFCFKIKAFELPFLFIDEPAMSYSLTRYLYVFLFTVCDRLSRCFYKGIFLSRLDWRSYGSVNDGMNLDMTFVQLFSFISWVQIKWPKLVHHSFRIQAIFFIIFLLWEGPRN